jgi:hypothetical protein
MITKDVNDINEEKFENGSERKGHWRENSKNSKPILGQRGGKNVR